MDLKALIAKMDHIESKQILNEGFPTVADAKARADKEKTTGKFDKKEIKPGVTQYTRKSSTFDDGGKDSDQKKAEKKKKNEGINFQSSIAQMLLKEFGLDERVTINPDGTTSGGIAPPPVAAGGEFKFTPEQEKFLGGANRQDPNIIARMPGAKPPVSYFKDPADQAIAKQLNFGQQNLNTLKTAVGAKPGDAQTFADPSAAAPAAAPAATGTQNQTPDAAAQDARIADRQDAEAVANTAGQAAQPAAGQAAQGVQVTPLGEPAANNSTTDTKAAQNARIADRMDQEAGNNTAGQTTAPAATPVAPAAGGPYKIKPGDNLTKIAKANGTTVQAIMQANPQIKDANKISAGASLTLPTAGQAAQPAAGQAAQPAAGQAAQPAAGQAAQPAAAKVNPMPDPNRRTGTMAQRDEWISKYGKTHNQDGTPKSSNQAAAPNLNPMDKFRKFVGIPAGGTKPQGQAAQTTNVQTQSVKNEDDAILERIRTALFR